MNSYLSRAEKETFVRLTALAGLQEQIINTYSEGNNADKEFLRNLRMAKTYLTKALDRRVNFLDTSASLDLAKQVTRLELLFVPSDKAREELKTVKELQSYLHMPLTDFEDWYCEVIEYACKTCSREDYKKCAMRSIMAKYGVFPANPEAKNCCQYSYVGVPEENIPVRPERGIEEEVDIIEPMQLESRENISIDNQVLSARNEKLAALPERKALEGMVPADFYLKDGKKIEENLPENMARNLIEIFKSIDKNNRPICACHIDNQFFTIDTQELVLFRAYNVGEIELEVTQEREPFKKLERSTEFSGLPESYKIECKCGAEYFCKLSKNKYRARCRECGETVFTDRTAEKEIYPPTGDEATLMTNRYWVEKDVPPEDTHKEKPLKNINKNFGKSYVDPCNLAI